jgi:hypothetical protein
MREILLISILLMPLYSLKGNAQSFSKGYIINCNEDTFQVYIKRSTELKRSTIVQYKYSLTSDTLYTISPESSKGFFIEKDSQYYQSVKYIYNTIENIRFAKSIYANNVCLYKLRIPDNEQDNTYGKTDHFVYIVRKDSDFFTLSQKENVVRQKDFKVTYIHGEGIHETKTYSVMNDRYKGILKYLFSDCPAITEEINKLKFHDDDIISIVDKYNKCIYNSPPRYINKQDIRSLMTFSIGYSHPFADYSENEGKKIADDGLVVGVDYLHFIKYPALAVDVNFNIENNPVKSHSEFDRFTYLSLTAGPLLQIGNIKNAVYISSALGINRAYLFGMFGDNSFCFEHSYKIGVRHKIVDLSLKTSFSKMHLKIPFDGKYQIKVSTLQLSFGFVLK